MNDIKVKLPVKLADLASDPNLPQVIVELQAPAAFFPEARPARQIKIIKMNIGKRRRLGRLFDSGAIALARDHTNIREARNLAHPVPTDTRLGTLRRLAGIRGKQHTRTPSAILRRLAHELAEALRSSEANASSSRRERCSVREIARQRPELFAQLRFPECNIESLRRLLGKMRGGGDQIQHVERALLIRKIRQALRAIAFLQQGFCLRQEMKSVP